MAQYFRGESLLHESGIYRRFAFVPFAYALVLTVPAELMLLALDMTAVMVALVALELIAFLLLPYIPSVRRAIDRRLEARARVEASAARSVLLLRMSEFHRRELGVLERIAAALYERTEIGQQHDCAGIERLIELYVKLAIAHRTSACALEVVDHRPDDELATLEARTLLADRTQREWIGRRVEILRMRKEARRAAHEEQARIRHDLALIGDTLRWMQESCASAGTESVRAEVELALKSRDRDASTLRELSTLRDTELDTSVIRLGREATGAVRSESDHTHTRIALSDELAGTSGFDDEARVRGVREDELMVRLWPNHERRAANDPTVIGEPSSGPRLAHR